MSAIQLPLVPAQRHRNQQLFADYYLNHLLPQRPDWRTLADDAQHALTQIAAIWAQFAPSSIEAQTEDGLIKPVLVALGHTFEVQATLATPDGTKRPDYVFYRDTAALNANKSRTLDETLLRPAALAVGDAKAWDVPLDQTIKKTGGDPFTNKNPSYQIAFYIQHSGLAWGILTNGRRWRLYHKDTAHKLDRFYEVDLPELLASGDASAFVYFYAFFRRAAFDAGPLSLAELLRESSDYARGVGDTLKRQVYDALRHLAQGFLDYPANRLAPDDATLRAIYDHSLIVLYRLLFILYAEARGLLPLRESALYRDRYSLYALTRGVADDLRQGLHLLPTSARLWPQLRELFGIISAGSPPLQVATFNGGLFDAARYPFLEQHTVGDYHLQQALDKLARVDGQFIDYRDLAEQHLGTIYEGLLEHHLEPVQGSGIRGQGSGVNAVNEPLIADLRPLTPDPFTIDLFNDQGERHRTGSYYTPDFIVRYMVDQTLGPVLAQAVASAPDEAAKVRAVLAINCIDPSMGSGHFLVEATEYIARFLVDQGLTPESHGTGNNNVIGALLSPVPSNLSPDSDLAYWKRRVVQSCIYGVDLNPLAVDLAKLSLWLSTVAKDRPLSFLDHHLRCGNALVGALTLAGVGDQGPRVRKTQRRPRTSDPQPPTPDPAVQLSMLDDDAFRQSMSTAVSSMWLIEGSAGATVAEVKEQERLYAELRATLTRRYARLADLHTATRFGVQVDAALWSPLRDFATGRTLAAPAKFSAWLDAAAQHAERQRFFHWALEFPEVFFDQHGQPLGARAGFDAVLGNPPYVRQETLGPLKPYLQAAYAETYHGMADLYVYFYQQGVRLLRDGGRMSYIVTNKWLRAGYGEGLRAFFAEARVLEQIIDFGHAPIFPDADVFPCIVVLHKPGVRSQKSEVRSQTAGDAGIITTDGPPTTDKLTHQEHQEPSAVNQADGDAVGSRFAALGSAPTVRVTAFPRAALRLVQLDGYVQRYGHNVPQSRFTAAPWSLETGEVDALMAKIRAAGVPLAQFAGVKPYYGIKTGLNEAFLIDTPTKERLVSEDARSAEIIKPYLRGQDIKRWSPEWDGLWMIFARRGVDIEQYPAIKRHLLQFRERLEPEPRNWTGGKWTGRKPGSYQWFEIQDSVDYWRLFEQPKICYQVIQFYPQYSLDESGVFHNDKGFSLPTADGWLLAVLNSPLMWWHNWRYLPHMKDEALTPLGFLVEQIPIAPPTDDQRAEVEPAVARLVAITRADQEARRDTLDWLRTEFDVATPGQRLAAFAALDETAFVAEVRTRRPNSAGKLSPAALKALRSGYAEQATPVQGRRAEAAALEQRLAALVNAAYGLTPEDVALLWRTAPPRMPGQDQTAQPANSDKDYTR